MTRRRRTGRRWRYTGTTRRRLAPGVRANVTWRRVWRALADGWGGTKLRDAVSFTLGWLGHATINTRTGDGYINTPGPGGFRGPAIRSQRQRQDDRAARRRRPQLNDDMDSY